MLKPLFVAFTSFQSERVGWCSFYLLTDLSVVSCQCCCFPLLLGIWTVIFLWFSFRKFNVYNDLSASFCKLQQIVLVVLVIFVFTFWDFQLAMHFGGFRQKKKILPFICQNNCTKSELIFSISLVIFGVSANW